VREQRRRTHVYPSLLAEIFDLEIISYLIFWFQSKTIDKEWLVVEQPTLLMNGRMEDLARTT
jgi:hypothetical protein